MNWDNFWLGLDSFFANPLGKLVSVALIILSAIVVAWIAHRVIRHVVDRIVHGVKKQHGAEDTSALTVSPLAAVRVVQRTRTLGTVLGNIVNVTIVIVTVLLVITTIDDKIIGSFALLTAALGAGLGFGAQNIVKDVLNGLFMVVEDQLGVGDIVDLGFATGVVESVGIRVTQVRDVNGTLWFVRNGEILRVGNMSQGWARVIIDLAVPYDADIEAVQSRMLDTANDLAKDPKWRPRILEKPEIWGIESVSDEAVIVRIVIKTRAATKDDVARELRGRLKKELDSQGIHLPSLQSVVLSGFDGATSVGGSRPPRTRPVSVPEQKPAPRRMFAKRTPPPLPPINKPSDQQ